MGRKSRVGLQVKKSKETVYDIGCILREPLDAWQDDFGMHAGRGLTNNDHDAMNGSYGGSKDAIQTPHQLQEPSTFQ